MFDAVTDKLNLANRQPSLGNMPLGLLAIVVANLSVLFIYLALDLSLYQLTAVYWWETFWIGLFCVLKILVASMFGSPYDTKNVRVSGAASLFFSVCAIALVGGQFLGMFIFLGFFIGMVFEYLTGVEQGELFFSGLQPILAASVVFLVGHGLSFVSNFLIGGEYKNASVGALLILPFRRCLAIFAAIGLATLGAVLIPGFSNTVGFAVLLIPIKLFWDYLLHKIERRSFESAAE